MRRVPADDCAETDERVVLAAGGDLLGREWNLEGARHADHVDAVFVGAVRLQRLERAVEEPFCHEIVEAADDDGELEAAGVEPSLNRFWHERRYFPDLDSSLEKRCPIFRCLVRRYSMLDRKSTRLNSSHVALS